MTDHDWNSAYETFRGAVRSNPDSLLYRQCVRGVAQKLTDNPPDSPKDQNVLPAIRKAAEQQDWQQADTLCEDALGFAPRDAELNYLSAVANYHLQRFDIALFSCRAALVSDPSHEAAVALLQILSDGE